MINNSKRSAILLGQKAFIIIFCVLFSHPDLLGGRAFAQSPQHRAVTQIDFGDKLGTGGLNKIQPLKVGDKIPEELWDMPLRVVNHPEGKEFIRLSDYQDKKLIILDFWNTWCSNCILEFPVVKALQDHFKDNLIFISVTTQKVNIVADFISNNENAKAVDLWSVAEAEVLNKAIQKFSVPHFAWIAGTRLISNTTGAALQEDFIQKYLASGTITWEEKVTLNKREPFWSSLGDLPSSSSSYYFEGELDGAGSGSGILPFLGDRTNLFFRNSSSRYIHDWFLRRIAQSKGLILKDIKYSTDDLDQADWKAFNDLPISLQIITSNKKSIEELFQQFQTMSSFRVEEHANGTYRAFRKRKEVER